MLVSVCVSVGTGGTSDGRTVSGVEVDVSFDVSGSGGGGEVPSGVVVEVVVGGVVVELSVPGNTIGGVVVDVPPRSGKVNSGVVVEALLLPDD